MVKRVLGFLKTPASINIIVNTAGNYLSVLFTAFFVVVLTRILTLADYGSLNVLLAIAYVISNVLDFGTTATIYAYLPPLLQGQRLLLYRFVKSTFLYQTLFSTLAVLLLVLLFPYADQEFFKTGAPHWQLVMTAISVLLFIWQNFITNLYFAAKQFLKANIYANISNAVKSLVLLALALTHTADVGSIIIVFGILGPLIFFVFVFFDRQHAVRDLVAASYSVHELRFGYTFKYFVATQLFNLGSRMDLFILSHFSYIRSKEEVGHYALAQKIILTIITTVVSITQVLSPTFSKIKTRAQVKSAFKHGFVYMLIPTALFICLYFTPEFVYNIIFTRTFATQTIEITRELTLPFVLYALGSLPLLFLLYTIKKPVYVLISNAIFFVIMTVGCFWTIPTQGVYGPPPVIFWALTLAIGIQLVATVVEYQKLPE